MAKPNTPAAAPAASNPKDAAKAAEMEKGFDWTAANLPEGYDASGFTEVAGLTPIYSSEEAHEEDFPPVIGLIDRIETLPPVLMGRDWFIPRMIRVVAMAPTKAVVGKRGARQVVDVPKGEDVLIPVTGNLANSRRLMAACRDPENVHLGAFKIKGTIPTGQPTPMWDWSVGLNEKKIKREGRFAAPFDSGAIDSGQALKGVLPQTATGQPYDPRTGEVKDTAPVARS